MEKKYKDGGQQKRVATREKERGKEGNKSKAIDNKEGAKQRREGRQAAGR